MSPERRPGRSTRVRAALPRRRSGIEAGARVGGTRPAENVENVLREIDWSRFRAAASGTAPGLDPASLEAAVHRGTFSVIEA